MEHHKFDDFFFGGGTENFEAAKIWDFAAVLLEVEDSRARMKWDFWE